MKAQRLFSLGAILVLLGCDQGPITDPMEPEALVQGPETTTSSMDAETFCTYKCTQCLPPSADACEWHCVFIGPCRDNLMAADRNANGKVCSATEDGEGPFIDDVWPQVPVLRLRPEITDPCPSPRYPHWIDVEVVDS